MGKEGVFHIHSGILFSHKKNEIKPFAAKWMQLEIIILSKVSQTEKDKYSVISLNTWNLKRNDTNELTKQKQSHICRKQIYGYQKGKGGTG